MPEKMRQLFDRFLLIGLLGLILTTIWKPANPVGNDHLMPDQYHRDRVFVP